MKGFNKWMSGLLAVCMLLSLLPVSALAHDSSPQAEESGITEQPEFQTVTSSVAEITASETADGLREGDFIYSVTDGIATITEYVGSDEDITVPGEIGGYPVAAIGRYTFYCNSTVRSITIGEGIQSLSSEWAYDCSALETISFPSTLSMTAEDGSGAISGLADLPNACLNVKTLIVAEGSPYLTVYNGALYDKAMTALLYYPPAHPGTVLEIPEGVKSIGDSSCTYAVNLKEVKMPDTVEYIGYWSFWWCENLEKINISESCTFIGQNVFHFTALKSIHIPASLITLASGSFGTGCMLETITVDPANPYYYAEDNVLYCAWDTGKSLVKYPAGSGQTQFTIPEDVTEIEWLAFDSAENLAYVDIPSGVTYIGCFAFNRCFNLEAVTLGDGPTKIDDNAFFDCRSLKELAIPASVTSMGDYLLGNCRPNRVVFYGDAPEFSTDTFVSCVTTAYYPKDNATWTADVRQQYGGTITWQAYNPANPFLDVPTGSYCETPVIWAVENGITNGTSATTFSPNNPCTRWQVVTFLWRAAGCPEPSSMEHSFTDIPSGSFYLKAVLWAVENGITNGTTATTFSPNDICTRWQIVTFLWRYAGCPEPTKTTHSFTDVAPTSFYRKAILWAVEKGITNGTTATTFAPNAPCTRAQIVTFLYRYMVE